MNWTHPTGAAPKTVALICLGPSRSAYEGACMQHDLDECVLGVDETWTLNRGIGIYNHDLLWVMDHIQGEADKNPRYGASLWRHDRPIITSDNCEGWPKHVHKYPFNEIWEWLREKVQPMHGDWYHNSVAYILCYAAFIGVRELRVFGADYHNHRNGAVEDGHTNVAYWVGRLESAGLVVKAPAETSFLNINQRDWIYGYQHDPRRIPANRARFRSMIGMEQEPDSVALLSGERQVSEDIEGIQPDHRYRYEWAATKVYGTVLDCGGGIGYGSALMADQPNVSTVWLLERSLESLDYAQKYYRRPNIWYRQVDLEKPRKYQSEPIIDWATAFEVIEHLANPSPFLSSLPAKGLLCSVPNEEVIPYSPETAPFHHRHYKVDQITCLLRNCGWEPTGIYGQLGPDSDVIPWQSGCRTIIIEAERNETAGHETETA